MAIKIGGTTVVDDNFNYNAGIATFTALDFPINILTFSPSIGQVNVAITTNILLTFNQQVAIGTTGNITIREGSASGVAIQTIGITSSSVTLSSTGFQVTIDPPSNLGYGKTYYPVISGGAFVAQGSPSIGRTSSVLNTYYFATESFPNVGTTFEGGRIICKNGGTAWIVAPSSSQVSRTWYCRGDALTTAQACTGVSGWFVPTSGQLHNPGFTCRTYWDSYVADFYWSDTTSGNFTFAAYYVCFGVGNTGISGKTSVSNVRALRCVTY